MMSLSLVCVMHMMLVSVTHVVMVIMLGSAHTFVTHLLRFILMVIFNVTQLAPYWRNKVANWTFVECDQFNQSRNELATGFLLLREGRCRRGRSIVWVGVVGHHARRLS